MNTHYPSRNIKNETEGDLEIIRAITLTTGAGGKDDAASFSEGGPFSKVSTSPDCCHQGAWGINHPTELWGHIPCPAES